MQLTLNSAILAKFPTRDVFLSRTLGGFELTFQFQGEIVSAPPEKHRRFELRGARIMVQPSNGSTQTIGRAFPIIPLIINQTQTPHPLFCQFSLAIELSPLQLEKLEEVRGAGSMQFQLAIDGTGTDGNIVEAFMPQTVLNWTVPKSTWVEMLNSAGARQTMLFEIPIQGEWETALSHPGTKPLRKAHQAFGNSDWSGVISECRKVAETLEGRRLGTLKSEFSTKSGTMSKRDRTTILLVAIQNYCHMAAHAKEGTDPVEFSREDAQLILSMTASYVNWFARSAEG